jgi:hypothetical protein
MLACSTRSFEGTQRGSLITNTPNRGHICKTHIKPLTQTKEVVVNKHAAQITTSKAEPHLGIITVSKQKLTTHEKEHAPNIQEVVVANPSTSTTTSNSLSRSTCC